MSPEINKTDQDWKQELTPEQFEVLRLRNPAWTRLQDHLPVSTWKHVAASGGSPKLVG